MTDTQTDETSNFVPHKSGRLSVPKIGQLLSVTLPGEILRAEVVDVIDDDHIVCKIAQPMAKSHNYQAGQNVRFRRSMGLVREFWEVDN